MSNDSRAENIRSKSRDADGFKATEGKVKPWHCSLDLTLLRAYHTV